MGTYSQSEAGVKGWSIRVKGTVQGVGFRPTVFTIAKQLGVNGKVLNDGDGVLIEAFAPIAVLQEFVQAIREKSPPLALIESITYKDTAVETSAIPTSFAIDLSENSAVATNIAADAATCQACLADIFNRHNRRYRYPFTNCTHCGPRLSIISAIPYDRAKTSMAPFRMCTDCQSEYQDANDRRFHAQPNACSLCGPKVWLEDRWGNEPTAEHDAIDAIEAAADLIKKGEIVAIKGIGGFHLACAATNDKAVTALRQRKKRFEKPFALMARDLDLIKSYCLVSTAEETLLKSHEAPIVLLEQKSNDTRPRLSAAVAPKQTTLGFMLPYSPLHHLLLQKLNIPIVLTSGNLSEEPQCIENDEAKEYLGQIADFFLLHNRAIVNRLDDSVVRANDAGFEVLRRARGYAPTPIKLPPGFEAASGVLALGAELKNTFCLLQNNSAIMSQHMGDLEDAKTYSDYQKNLALYKNCFQFEEKRIAIDFHPEYLSSKWGRNLVTEIDQVQHHHAHIAACLADNDWPREAGPVLGVALDGLGYGLDDSYWGGEFLLADYGSFERIATFKPVAMLGGAKAMKEPWRNAYAHIVAAMGWQNYLEQYAELPLTKYLQTKPLATYEAMLRNKRNAPLASSCGRLFDAVAAAIGICRAETSYEGQAAIELEALVNSDALEEDEHTYSFVIDNLQEKLPYIDSKTMWPALLTDLSRGTTPPVMASRFHLGLAKAIIAMVEELSSDHKDWLSTVALSGGVFQNKVLLNLVKSNLVKKGYKVLTHRQVPTNDGGISLGQAVISAAGQIEKKERSHVSWHTWASR